VGFEGKGGFWNGYDFGLAYSIPIAAEYFIGDLEKAGAFGGVGFNYSSLALSNHLGGSFGVIGPEISAGAVFRTQKRDFLFRNNGTQISKIRVGYTFGLNKGDWPTSSSFQVLEDKRHAINVTFLTLVNL
jgi:hypothetical protein